MKLKWCHHTVLLLCMLAAAVAAHELRPTHKLADEQAPVNLHAMIPLEFGDWVQDGSTSLMVVDPGQQKVLSKIYSQTLARTYKNSKGYRIMLSMAYGGDQSDAMELHKPEICYPAQGFVVLNKYIDVLALTQKSFPVTRLNTNMGLRSEPLTYWTIVGDQVVVSGLAKKVAELKYGLVGKIPDGILVRLSSLDDDLVRAHDLQNIFAQDMVSALAPEARAKIIGSP